MDFLIEEQHPISKALNKLMANELTTEEKEVYSYLLLTLEDSMGRNKEEGCFISAKSIGISLGMSEKTVALILKGLEGKEFICSSARTLYTLYY